MREPPLLVQRPLLDLLLGLPGPGGNFRLYWYFSSAIWSTSCGSVTQMNSQDCLFRVDGAWPHGQQLPKLRLGHPAVKMRIVRRVSMAS